MGGGAALLALVVATYVEVRSGWNYPEIYLLAMKVEAGLGGRSHKGIGRYADPDPRIA